MNLTNERCANEVSALISIGLLEYLIDEDGNFCYELTEEGHKVARGEKDIEDYEYRKVS